MLAPAKSGKYTLVLGKHGFRAPRSTARYEVRDWLGGAVYRARVTESQHAVALKSLQHLDPKDAPRIKQRFEVAARARHPNLVALYELALTTDSWFYAMELVDGVNVMAWVSREQPSDGDTVPSTPRRLRADLDRLRPVMRQLADGITALHDAGLRHDNLKPSNVLVTSQGRVVLTDFGMTDQAALFATLDNPLSSNGTYISPEQAGAGTLTPASDWYALGVMLYEALTGRLPFAANMSALVSHDPPPPSELVDGIPAEVDALAMHLLSRDPATRASAQDVLDVFEEAPRAETKPKLEESEKLAFAGTDRFEVTRQLGRGGMGVVYEAIDRERGMKVALKTLLRVDPGAIYRFKQEFRALVDVAHPNLIALYELVSIEGNYFFTMELLDGVDFVSFVRGRSGSDHASGRSADAGTRSLSSQKSWSSRPPQNAFVHEEATAVLTSRFGDDERTVAQEPLVLPEADEVGDAEATPINWVRLRDALLQLAHGVYALHASGHMHRDIKPSNVLVQPDGRVVLLDFGVIAELGAARHGTQELVGTPMYMAPEQARGKITKASDWYAVGVVLYRVLTGALPYVGSMEQVLFAKQDEDPIRPDEIRDDLPVDLVELCVELLNRDPEKRPSGEQVLSRLGATRDSRLLELNVTARHRNSAHTEAQRGLSGRDRHLMELRDAFANVKRGIGQTVLVHGSSGMGKSALIDQFLEEIGTAKGVILTGRCYEREQVPYKGVDAAIDALSRYLLSLDDDSAAAIAPRDLLPLARVFPVLESVPMFARLDHNQQAAPEPRELRHRAFAALRALLTKIASTGPLVLFIDDAQWGDRDSAPLLEQLMRPPNVPPLLLLLGYRSEDAARSPLLSSLLSKDSLLAPGAAAREVHVGPLTEDESRSLAYQLLATEGADTDAAWTIARESRGHPYFIHELARYVKAEGLAEGIALSLDMVIGKRVGRLPESARRLMEIVAVAGQPISQILIGHAVGIDAQERITLMNQLRVAQLIRTSGVGDLDLAEPYHDRIRALLVSLLSPQQLARDHGVLATVMLNGPEQPDPEALVTHFQGAGDVQRAFTYATKAGDRAAAALAFDRAASLYRQALEMQPEPETRRSLDERLGDALRNAGRGAEAAAAYLAAAEGAPVERRLVNQRLAAEQLLYTGHLDDGLRIIDDVLRTVNLSLAKTPTRALLSLLWRRFRLKVRGLNYTPRTVAEIPREQLQLIDTCYGIGTSLALVDVIRANAFQTLNLRLSLDAGEPYRISRSLSLDAGFIATIGAGQAPRVASLLGVAKQLSQQTDNPHAAGMHLLASGISAYEMGQIRASSDYCDAAEDLLRTQCSGVPWELASARLFGSWSKYRLGDIASLVDRVPALEREAAERGDLYGRLAMTLGCPRLAMTLVTDDPLAQRAIAEESIASWPGDWYQVQHYWADYSLLNIDLYANQPEIGWARIEKTWPLLEKALLLRVEEVKIYMSEVKARLALALAMRTTRRGSYLSLVEKVARHLDKRSMIPWCGAMANLLRAQVAALEGNHQRELELLTHACAGFEIGELAGYEMVTRMRIGVLIGGAAGAEQVGVAQTWAHTARVANLTGLTRLLAPVFASDRPALPA